MDLKLVKESDPILRQIATEWDFNKEGCPEELITNMTNVMLSSNGIGLAAPQVGISKRIFIMGDTSKIVACINPIIVSGTDLCKNPEGCLSFPDLILNLSRYRQINVKYHNVHGVEIQENLDGLLARVYQHELDHLDGICFDSKVSKLSLDLAKKRRKKLRHSFN